MLTLTLFLQFNPLNSFRASPLSCCAPNQSKCVFFLKLAFHLWKKKSLRRVPTSSPSGLKSSSDRICFSLCFDNPIFFFFKKVAFTSANLSSYSDHFRYLALAWVISMCSQSFNINGCSKECQPPIILTSSSCTLGYLITRSSIILTSSEFLVTSNVNLQ